MTIFLEASSFLFKKMAFILNILIYPLVFPYKSHTNKMLTTTRFNGILYVYYLIKTLSTEEENA